MTTRPTAPRRPSLLLGCGGFLALAVALGFLVGGCIVFLDSGANRGRVVLLPADSYEDGHIEFVGEHNFYLVRLGDEFFALDDLDAANAANPDRQCRVRLADSQDPAIAPQWDFLASRQSPQAAGTLVVLSEDCNGAVYDVAGIRLDSDGPNLDRYGVTIRNDGRVVVDLSESTCSVREGEALSAEC